MVTPSAATRGSSFTSSGLLSTRVPAFAGSAFGVAPASAGKPTLSLTWYIPGTTSGAPPRPPSPGADPMRRSHMKRCSPAAVESRTGTLAAPRVLLVARLGPRGPGGPCRRLARERAQHLALRVQDLHRHRSGRLARQEVVDVGAGRRVLRLVGPAAHRVVPHAPGGAQVREARLPLHRRAVRRRDGGRHLLQRQHVVHDEEPAPHRREHEVAVVDADVGHRRDRQVLLERLPVGAVVERDEEAELGARVEQPLAARVLADHARGEVVSGCRSSRRSAASTSSRSRRSGRCRAASRRAGSGRRRCRPSPCGAATARCSARARRAAGPSA